MQYAVKYAVNIKNTARKYICSIFIAYEICNAVTVRFYLFDFFCVRKSIMSSNVNSVLILTIYNDHKTINDKRIYFLT